MAKDIGATVTALAGNERRLFVTAPVASVAPAVAAILFAPDP